MGLFATYTRNGRTAGSGAGTELPERVRRGLPDRFEAVGEALASGSGLVEACDVAGRLLAEDGASLDEVLGDLQRTGHLVVGRDPGFRAARALSVAWSEATLGYLHQLSCEDPMTGLASLAHLRARLSELYRGQLREREVATTSALVVIELPRSGAADGPPQNRFTRSLHLARLGEAARTVFSGSETVARSGTSRVVVLVDRDQRLGRRVALLRTMLRDAGPPTRVWIEGLPSGDEAAAGLLDELSRP